MENVSIAVEGPAPTVRRTRQWPRLLAVNGIIVFVLVGGGELTLRALGIRPKTTASNLVYVNDPLGGPWLEPSQSGFIQGTCLRNDDIHTNAFGMRDKERSLEAKGPRIAVVGDSMVQGLQVKDADVFTRKLEDMLEGRAEVLNFGVSSVGTAVEILNYRKRVRQFHPDTVLLVFALSNDVYDNLEATKLRIDPGMGALVPYWELDADGKLKPEPKPGRQDRTSRISTLAASTSIGQWLHYTYQELKRGRIRQTAKGAAAPYEKDALAGVEPFKEDAWKVTEALLLRFHEEVEKDHAHFALVIVPPDPVDFTKGKDEIARLWAVAAKGGFPALDLSKALIEKKGDRTLPFSFVCDLHWNAEGHRVAAEAIHQFLKEQQWL